MTLPMIIDSFAGGGGASTGIELALGRSPDVAINHSANALALHAANHPDTLHLDSNIWDVQPREVTKGRKVGLLWASPDCKHFSKAKGGAPRDRNIRDLAWVIVRWAEEVRPDVILMENVEEFTTWGPVDNDGQPIKEFSGQTFDDWKLRLRRAGYKLQHRELRACDYGAPTIRKRFFLIARCDGLPITWPKPSHGDPKSPEVKRGKLKPWRTAAECIDWSLPCPSIFATGPEIMADHGLRAVRPLADNTLARIARGMKRYVLEAETPFLVNVANSKTTGRAPNVWTPDEPLRTITSAPGFGVVAPSITRFNGGATGQDLRDPMQTVTANSFIKRPGGAAPIGLLAPSLVSIAHGYSGGRREYPLTDPLGTVTVGGIQHAITAPSLMSLKGTARRDSAADAPHPTVLAGGGHSALISPVLTYAQHGGQVRDMADPVHTIAASRKDQNAVIVPHMMTMRNAAKPFNGADEPLQTITAGGAGLTTVAAFLAQHNLGATGHDPRDPLSTIAATGSHQTPVAAWFAKYYGTGDGARTDDPMHTITVKDRMGHMQADLAAPPFGPEHEARARQVADFLRAHDAWTGGEFVTLTIAGQTFVVVDIGMRMLTPRELFNAQGFPFFAESYTFSGWRDRTTHQAGDQEPAGGKSARAKCAEIFFPWSLPFDQRGHAVVSARIDLGQKRLVVSSQEKSTFAAPSAAESASFRLPTEIVNIVRRIVRLRQTPGQTTGIGRAGQRANAKLSTLLIPGGPSATAFGNVTTHRAEDASGSINIQSVDLKSTTSQAGQLSQTCASMLETLFCYVANVTASSTLGSTKPMSLFDAELTIDASYAIDGRWVEVSGDWVWKPFTKDVQVSCCGNSVCPDLARALVEANCQHLKQQERAA